MNQELQNGNEQISEEQWEGLKQEAQQYFDLGMSVCTDTSSGSCRHILRNLCTALRIAIDLETSPEKRTNRYVMVSSSLGYVKKYLAFLDEFPDFKAKELGGGEGAYPELLKKNLSSGKLIDEYEKVLRGTQ